MSTKQGIAASLLFLTWVGFLLLLMYYAPVVLGTVFGVVGGAYIGYYVGLQIARFVSKWD